MFFWTHCNIESRFRSLVIALSVHITEVQAFQRWLQEVGPWQSHLPSLSPQFLSYTIYLSPAPHIPSCCTAGLSQDGVLSYHTQDLQQWGAPTCPWISDIWRNKRKKIKKNIKHMRAKYKRSKGPFSERLWSWILVEFTLWKKSYDLWCGIKQKWCWTLEFTPWSTQWDAPIMSSAETEHIPWYVCVWMRLLGRRMGKRDRAPKGEEHQELVWAGMGFTRMGSSGLKWVL